MDSPAADRLIKLFFNIRIIQGSPFLGATVPPNVVFVCVHEKSINWQLNKLRCILSIVSEQ